MVHWRGGDIMQVGIFQVKIVLELETDADIATFDNPDFKTDMTKRIEDAAEQVIQEWAHNHATGG